MRASVGGVAGLVAALALLAVVAVGCGKSAERKDAAPMADTVQAESATPDTAAAGGAFTDSRDGKKYRVVKIGNLTWMAENLNYQTGKSWCYENDGSNCQKYGRLYDWNTAMNACPSGWRLPAPEDWNDLVEAAGGDAAGTKLKSKSPDWDGTDDYGYSALPGGTRYTDGAFREAGTSGYWWSATENGNDYAYRWSMETDFEVVHNGSDHKGGGLSARCVQGTAQSQPAQSAPAQSAPAPTSTAALTDPRDGKTYRTVSIGGKTWMAENLNYHTGNSRCYGDDVSNCQKYGRLYDWNTAMSACPSEWRLPTREDWNDLVETAGGDVAGTKLKANNGWSSSDNIPGTDDYGFSALPGGFRHANAVNFYGADFYGNWWSATEYVSGGGYAYIRGMYSGGINVSEDYYDKGNWYSVRCIKNN